MSSQYSALVDKIRSKYPHQYDDLSDDELGKKWITKYPQYQDLVKPIEPVPIPKVQTTAEADKSRFMEATGGEKPLATPVLPFGAAFTSAPKMIAGVVGGMGGTEAGTQLGKFMNLSPEHTRWVSDVLGFLTSAAATHGEGKVEPFLKGARLRAPEGVKLPLGFKIERPPAPEPPLSPQEAEYQRAKTITEAQEAAAAEKTKREAAATRESTRAAKAKEAGFNKEAQDRMAIQKRADDAEASRVKAEKDAKNARFKADQEHERELAAAEKARQDEITAQAKLRQVQDQMKAADEAKEQGRLKLLQQQEKQAIQDANEAAAQKERLRNQHADALMRRGREQAALDKAAEDANAEEDSAKSEVRKKASEGGGGGGGRPTASERFLTGLLKRNVLTPEEDAQGSRLFGDKWKLRAGEGPAGRTNRLMGDIHAMRPAREMTDVSTGPVAQRTTIPPPPSPKVSFTTDTMGVRWAHSPESPNPVSIPKSVPEGEVEEYATQKLREQAEMARKVKSRVPGGSGESGASAEAINRTAAEKRAGVKYFIEDTRTKSRTPVSSTDVNAGLRVGPGKRIVRSGPEGEFEF